MGLTALDTGVLVAFLDGSDPFHQAAVNEMLIAAEGEMLLPAVAYSELAVGMLVADVDLDFLDEVLTGLRIKVGKLDQAASAAAAGLRAHSLRDRRRRQWRMPDALVVGEARAWGAETLVTTDARWPAVRAGLEIKVIRPL